MGGAIAKLTRCYSFGSPSEKLSIEVNVQVGPLAITSCSCIYSIVSVITPPVHAIILFAGIHNYQLVCQHLGHCFRKLFSHGRCLNSKCFHPLCDCFNVAFLRLYKLATREKHKAVRIHFWCGSIVCTGLRQQFCQVDVFPATHFLQQLVGGCRQSRANAIVTNGSISLFSVAVHDGVRVRIDQSDCSSRKHRQAAPMRPVDVLGLSCVLLLRSLSDLIRKIPQRRLVCF